MKKVIVITSDNLCTFEDRCGDIIKEGYVVSSTSCCAIDRYSFSFCAILIKKE